MPIELRIASGKIEAVTQTARERLFLGGAELQLPAGAVILPGFVDTHCHLIGLGLMRARVQLAGARTAEECARRVAERARQIPAGQWILGFGWNQEEWEEHALPAKEVLDVLVPNHPVALYRIDTHAAWVNSRAIAEAGITPTRIEGGSVATGADGTPNGLLIDAAIKLVERAIPEPSVAERSGWIEYGVEQCLRYGITEVHDMNVEPERLEPMALVAERGGMRIRCQIFLEGAKGNWKAVPVPTTLAPNMHAIGVKYFTDGALGSRGALLLQPYSDAPDTCGLQLMSAQELTEEASAALATGYAIATHAIGDAANRLTLDAYQTLRRDFPGGLLRIEHAQIVHPDDVPRFAELGVIPTIQPTHCTTDARMAEARLGPERCTYAYGWQNLRSIGVPLLGGSDFPIETENPLPGIRDFHYRTPAAMERAWYPEQAISQQEALDAYTRWAPLGILGGQKRGALTPGYDADIVVLSGNPFTDVDCHALYTIVAGNIEYRAE